MDSWGGQRKERRGREIYSAVLSTAGSHTQLSLHEAVQDLRPAVTSRNSPVTASLSVVLFICARNLSQLSAGLSNSQLGRCGGMFCNSTKSRHSCRRHFDQTRTDNLFVSLLDSYCRACVPCMRRTRTHTHTHTYYLLPK